MINHEQSVLASGSTDFHLHSNRSRCARSELSLAGLVRLARERGLTLMAVTDHLYDEESPFPEDVRQELDSLREEPAGLRGSNPGLGIKVLVGCEMSVNSSGRYRLANGPGGAPVGPKLRSRISRADLVLAGIHDAPELPPLQALESYVERLLVCMEEELVHVVAHPFGWGAGWISGGFEPGVEGDGGGVLESRRECEELFEKLGREVARLAQKKEIAVELNSGMLDPQFCREPECSDNYKARIPPFIGNYGSFLAACAEMGVKFTLGSDSHCPHKVGDLGPGLRVWRALESGSLSRMC